MKIDLSPSLDKFVTEKLKRGDYVGKSNPTST